MSDKPYKSALKVNPGVEKPDQVNPALRQGKKKFAREKPDVQKLFEGIRKSDPTALGRGITLIESTLQEDRPTAQQLIQMCLPYSGNSFRLGITGVPGVGKSTFIESFGLLLIEKGKRVAVLAIDPSSLRTKGSILGDKTRMESLGNHRDAFIRPSASAGTLGGVARKTRESMILCEAAGFDVIFIETVGVGQSETAVSNLVDFFLLLMLAGGGDELQGIKRGIMEMADLVVINKADGDNLKRAQMAVQEYKQALHLFPSLPNGWQPDVLKASAIQNEGLEEVWNQISSFLNLTKENGFFEKNRQQQALHILDETIHTGITEHFFNHPEINQLMESLKHQILEKKISPYEASEQLLSHYLKGKK
ncbi:MAG: methylmalonyl Co-A mutase-associated GTPase MeaB [Bacteroidales bacterium]|nr:methylmalonyl Co-A mutase-associated GTPase MeaB [Bacteroidales bacterium]